MVSKMVSSRAATSTRIVPLLEEQLPQGTETPAEHLRQMIQDIKADVEDLEAFYNINFSRTRVLELGQYFVRRANELVVSLRASFKDFSKQDQVDYVLLRKYLIRQEEGFRDELEQIDALKPLLHPWAPPLIQLCELRQKGESLTPQATAQCLHDAVRQIQAHTSMIDSLAANHQERPLANISTPNTVRAIRIVGELKGHLSEWFSFYNGYDPLFTWWVSAPWAEVPPALDKYAACLEKRLVQRSVANQADPIIGIPSGRESILADIRYEMIPYSPEEIIKIGEREYEWCVKEMIRAAQQLDPQWGENWMAAMQLCVKNMYVPPGDQVREVHALAKEAVEYVKQRDLVTIPDVANDTWRTFMMSPEKQKVNPFFLGGDDIVVSYPTSSMSHADKMMSLRGNNRPFSRSTVFHELLPGHKLQTYYMKRHRPYRTLFDTPFWIEGWAFYWEMILWDLGFAETPEEKIGMLFWRIHRCARIVFSLKFHLGELSEEQCVKYLIEKVGHDRFTAEGEVRRSFNGDYSPLYQAGYMLGALQLYKLRQEVLAQGKMSEKQFHDNVMKSNCMPIELVRALALDLNLEENYTAKWKFYGDL